MSESNALRTDSGRASWFLAFLVVFLAYAMTGRLGLMAAIPPGHVTAIWPPAGIALAAVTLRGPWMALAVASGSVVVNLWAAGSAGTLDAPMALTSILCIAAGAALQALAGSALVGLALERMKVSAPALLRSARGVTLFVAAAFASCLVNSTIGTIAVFLLQANAWPGFQTTWWTWWLGDAAGTLVFGPVILSFWQP